MSKAFVLKNNEGLYYTTHLNYEDMHTEDISKANIYNKKIANGLKLFLNKSTYGEKWEAIEITMAEGNFDTYSEDYIKLEQENKQLKEQLANKIIYIAKRPQGSYEDYKEEIEKVFSNKEKAEKYIQEENKKLPLDQANRCRSCTWHYQVGSAKQGKKPDCLKGYSFGTCANYLQYRDVKPLFIEEYETEE